MVKGRVMMRGRRGGRHRCSMDPRVEKKIALGVDADSGQDMELLDSVGKASYVRGVVKTDLFP